jgi:hypothetical protein
MRATGAHLIDSRSSKMIVSSSWNRIEIVYGNGPLFTPATVRSSSPQSRAQWSAE